MSQGKNTVTVGIYSFDDSFSKTVTYDVAQLQDSTVNDVINRATQEALTQRKFKNSFWPPQEGTISDMWFPAVDVDSKARELPLHTGLDGEDLTVCVTMPMKFDEHDKHVKSEKENIQYAINQTQEELTDMAKALASRQKTGTTGTYSKPVYDAAINELKKSVADKQAKHDEILSTIKDLTDRKEKAAKVKERLEELRRRNEAEKKEMYRVLEENKRMLEKTIKEREKNTEVLEMTTRVFEENKRLRQDIEDKIMKDQEKYDRFRRVVEGVALRALLDQARIKIATMLGLKSWGEVRNTFGPNDLPSKIAVKLPDFDIELLRFLCGPNNVRKMVDILAHSADLDDIRDAIAYCYPEQTDLRITLDKTHAFVINERKD